MSDESDQPLAKRAHLSPAESIGVGVAPKQAQLPRGDVESSQSQPDHSTVSGSPSPKRSKQRAKHTDSDAAKELSSWSLDSSGWLYNVTNSVYMDPGSGSYFALSATENRLDPCSQPPADPPSQGLINRALEFKKQSSQERENNIAPLNDDDEDAETTRDVPTDEDTEHASSIRSEALPLRFATETGTGRKDTNEDRFTNDVMLGSFGRYFGVFDGHAGTECADYAAQHLSSNLMGGFSHVGPLSKVDHATKEALRDIGTYKEQIKQLEVLHRASPHDPEIAQTIDGLKEITRLLEVKVYDGHELDLTYVRNVLKCIKDGFKCTDKNFLGLAKRKKLKAGSTALVAIVNGDCKYNAHVVIANLGDCRAVMCRSGRALALSVDHKPSRKDEEKRIRDAGGRVVEVYGVSRATTQHRGRMSSAPPLMLAVSRAFGDVSLKTPNPIVSFIPEIRIERITSADAFLVLACDGVWDVLTNQEAVDLAKQHYGKPRRAAHAIIEAAYEKQSNDNLTATVIEFAWNSLDAGTGTAVTSSSGSAGKAEAVGEQSAPTSEEANSNSKGGGDGDNGGSGDIDDMFA